MSCDKDMTLNYDMTFQYTCHWVLSFYHVFQQDIESEYNFVLWFVKRVIKNLDEPYGV